MAGLSYEDMARSHVKELAREAFELDEVVVDADGDLPFPCGTAMVYVSVTHEGHVMRVWSRAVCGTHVNKAVLREIDEVNRGTIFAKVFTRGDDVWVEAYGHVDSLSVRDVGMLVSEVGRTSDRVGSMIAAVHGGFVAFPEGCDAEHECEE